jgi:nucleoside-diphosphate-sugar epimerase
VRVLVTGGAGYLGCAVVPLLLGRGHFVRVLDLPPSHDDSPFPFRIENLGLAHCFGWPGLELAYGDVRNEPQAQSALDGVDGVVHLAAVVGHPACAADPALTESVNVGGTRTLLELRRPGQWVVLASTGSVYGRVPDGVCDESTAAAPLTVYGQTKATAERLALAAGNVTVLRFATAFGAGPVTRLDLLPNDLTVQALLRRRLLVYEPAARRSFLHVSDVARAIVFVVENRPLVRDQVLNVGDESLNITKAELAAAVARHVDCTVDLTGAGEDPDQRDYEMSFARLRRLRFTATIDLDTGLAHLVHALDSTGLVSARPGRRFLPHPAVVQLPTGRVAPALAAAPASA